MTKKEYVVCPPYASSRGDIRDLDVLVALVPIVAWAVFMFGWSSMLFVAVGVASSVVFEMVVELFLFKKIGYGVVNAALTGLLISLSVSPNAPVWLPVLGSAVAIFVAKYQFVVLAEYGSFFSPAALGMLICGVYPENEHAFVDGLRNALYPEGGMLNVFLGNTEGALGTVSALLLAFAAIYLLLRGALSFKTVLSALVVMSAMSLMIVPAWTTFSDNMIYQIIGGGFLFYLVFAAGDRMGSPVTEMGKLVYGAGFAALVFVFRFYTGLPACEAMSAVIMSILTPVIDLYTRQSPFGGVVRTAKPENDTPAKSKK